MKKVEEPLCYECDEYYEFNRGEWICPCCKHSFDNEPVIDESYPVINYFDNLRHQAWRLANGN